MDRYLTAIAISPHGSATPMPDMVASGLSGILAIRDRMPRFHEDSRNPRVSRDIAVQHKMNTTRTNAYENERKRTSRGCPYPPTIKKPPHAGGFSLAAG